MLPRDDVIDLARDFVKCLWHEAIFATMLRPCAHFPIEPVVDAASVHEARGDRLRFSTFRAFDLRMDSSAPTRS